MGKRHTRLPHQQTAPRGPRHLEPLVRKERVLIAVPSEEETFQIACAVEEFAPEILRRKKGDNINLCANVDLYSGITYRLLGIPEELFTPLFCVSRVAGWCAHRMEELTMPASRIIRPAYKSIQAERAYIPLEER